tara:strand:+ start:173 stop:340 length:168 start_codon:yes stop_codon:yes gene_type:complete
LSKIGFVVLDDRKLSRFGEHVNDASRNDYVGSDESGYDRRVIVHREALQKVASTK